MFLVFFLVKIARNENEQGEIVRILREPIVHQRHTAVVAMPRNYDNNADCRQILKVKLMFPSSLSLLFSAVTLFCLSADLLRVLFFPIISSHLYLSQFKNSANSHGNCTTKAICNQYIKFAVQNTYKSLFCTISLLFQQAFKSFICICSAIQLCTYP